MQFMALSSISKFDDFYAINLRNNKVNGAIGKLIKISVKRYMFNTNNHVESEDLDDGYEAQQT